MMISGLLFFISLITTLLVTLVAIPPRSQKNLHTNAVYIIVGKIKSIHKEEAQTSLGSDIHIAVTVHVEALEKDDSAALSDYYSPSSIRHDSDIVVHYWQIGSRPDGWVGPTGLYSQPQIDDKGRLFLDLNESNQLQIMEPNGWQSIS